MKKNKLKKAKKVFWITDFSGSRKTEIANKSKKFIEKKYGRTLTISGDTKTQFFSYKF